MRWLRLYSEFAFDPKIQVMNETLQRRYIMLLCLKCNGDIPKMSDEEIACALRLTIEQTEETKKTLTLRKLIDENWEPVSWDKRQYTSDDSTSRVQKHRAKTSKQVTEKKRYNNGSVTPPDTDTDTDKESDQDKDTEKDLNTDSVTDVPLVDAEIILPEKKPEELAFEQLWNIYPKKVAKKDAEKAFKKIKPREHGDIITGLERLAHSHEWTKENGRYIPYLATFLNGRRWTDEVNVTPGVYSPPKTDRQLREEADRAKREELAREYDRINGTGNNRSGKGELPDGVHRNRKDTGSLDGCI